MKGLVRPTRIVVHRGAMQPLPQTPPRVAAISLDELYALHDLTPPDTRLAPVVANGDPYGSPILPLRDDSASAEPPPPPPPPPRASRHRSRTPPGGAPSSPRQAGSHCVVLPIRSPSQSPSHDEGTLQEEPDGYALNCPDVVPIDVGAFGARSSSSPVRSRPLPQGHVVHEVLRDGSMACPSDASQLGSAYAEFLARIGEVTAVQGIIVNLCRVLTGKPALLRHVERALAGATSHARYRWGACACPLRQFEQERSDGYQRMVLLWCTADSLAIRDIEGTLIRRHTARSRSSFSRARCRNDRNRMVSSLHQSTPPWFLYLALLCVAQAAAVARVLKSHCGNLQLPSSASFRLGRDGMATPASMPQLRTSMPTATAKAAFR